MYKFTTHRGGVTRTHYLGTRDWRPGSISFKLKDYVDLQRIEVPKVFAAPVYVGPTCYWTRGAPVWDGYRGIWYRPRIQVCD